MDELPTSNPATKRDLTVAAIRVAIRSRQLRLRKLKRAIEDLESFQRIQVTEQRSEELSWISAKRERAGARSGSGG